MVDIQDLKSWDLTVVPVQVRPSVFYFFAEEIKERGLELEPVKDSKSRRAIASPDLGINVSSKKKQKSEGRSLNPWKNSKS